MSITNYKCLIFLKQTSKTDIGLYKLINQHSITLNSINYRDNKTCKQIRSHSAVTLSLHRPIHPTDASHFTNKFESNNKHLTTFTLSISPNNSLKA